MEWVIRFCILAIVLFISIRLKKTEKENDWKSQKAIKSKIENYQPSMITIYNKEREVVFRQPSLIALDKKTGIIRYVGDEVVGCRDSDIQEELIIGSPFRKGVVADFDTAADLIKILLRYLKIKKYLSSVRQRVAICVPVDMTSVEHKAWSECMLKAKARKVLIIEDSFQLAIQKIPAEYGVVIEITPEI